MHHEHRPLIDVEASEATLELIAVGEVDCETLVWARRGFRHRERIDLDLQRSPAVAATRFAIARVDQQSVEPRLEAIGIAQAGETLPGRYQGFLGRVLSPSFVTKDQPSDDEQAVSIAMLGPRRFRW